MSDLPNDYKNLSYRIEQLEKQYTKIDDKLDQVMNNHLHHLELATIQLKTKINIYTALNIGAIILGIIVSRMLS